jgi:hypothetical protein
MATCWNWIKALFPFLDRRSDEVFGVKGIKGGLYAFLDTRHMDMQLVVAAARLFLMIPPRIHRHPNSGLGQLVRARVSLGYLPCKLPVLGYILIQPEFRALYPC